MAMVSDFDRAADDVINSVRKARTLFVQLLRDYVKGMDGGPYISLDDFEEKAKNIIHELFDDVDDELNSAPLAHEVYMRIRSRSL